jgi:predicted RNA methylase
MAGDARQLLFDFSDFIETAVPAAPPKSLPLTQSTPKETLPRPASNIPETAVFLSPETFKPYGAWVNFNRRLTTIERNQINNQALKLLEKETAGLTAEEKQILRAYSGWGSLAASDERGVLYDYYTSPPIADMTWRLLHKISPINKGSRVLEPSCGTGVFFETAPEGLDLHGVELDKRTATVASRLHPEVTITNRSFEAYNLAQRDINNEFDYVIGNIPFGDRTLQTAFLDMREEKSLDRYFISRALDNLKPGGVLALITHPGILANKTNEEWRLAISCKAQFMGAVKLNDHSFHHSHSAVQPDILFFKKHPGDIEPRLSALPRNAIQETVFGKWAVNGYNYFSTRPNHVMGQISEGTGQWGHDEVKGTVTGDDINAMMAAFVPEAAFTTLYEEARRQFPLPEPKEAGTYLNLNEKEREAAAGKKLFAGSVKTADDSVYVLSGEFKWMLAVKNNPLLVRRLTAIQAISDTIRIIRLQMRQGETPGEYQRAVKEMLAAYQTRYATLPKDDTLVLRFLKNTPAVSGVYDAFIDAEADILNKPNLYDRNGKLVFGHNEAVNALTDMQQQMVDGTEENIRKLFPETASDLIAEMYRNPNIFLTPDNVWQLREDFISGNAWENIDALEARAGTETDQEKKEKLLYGKSEMEKAIGWIPIEEADFSPHASWIPEYVINSWVGDKDGLDRKHLTIDYKISKNEEGKWGIRYTADTTKYDKHWKEHPVYKGQWEEMADELIYYLNMQKQRSKYNDTETYAQEKNDSFKNYIANHKDFRDELEQKYNRIFNTELSGPVKTYPIYLEGWQTGVKTPRDHQWQSIHHLYRQGKGISALGTGFGKTLAAIALHTLLTQEGKIRRAWFQVPNNKVKDWVKEIREVLPYRKVGFVDPEMRGYSNRETRYALYQQLANSDYDIILLPESAASEIQLSPEHDYEITSQVISKHLIEKANTSERNQENTKENAARKLENGKTNRTICFEDFGCDAIFVDEAHRYKNLFTSSLSRETGLNDGRTSAKAMALFKKAEYVRRQNNGKNIFLLTATPLTNSPLEYYNMLMFIAPEELEKFGIYTIDGFIKNFANIEQGYTYDWKTGDVSAKRILTGFKNIQTLQNIFFKYTDYQNDPEKINLVKPTAYNKPNVIPLNAKQTAVLKEISTELESYINCPKKDREYLFPGQNFLTVSSRMRTASLDLELYNPGEYKDWENPKLNKEAQNARAVYEKTKAGQVVFCDRVFSSDGSFNIHEKIRQYLIKAGFGAHEIIIVNGFTKSGGMKSDGAVEKEVSQAVEAFNSGRYKVLIGSTACIGEGLNLQENSAALHHFDIPYRPSDFIQRNGRIDRQGNRQNSVELHTYMSAGTIDNYSVALVQRKANWIDKLLKTTSHVFLNPNDDNYIDADELLLALTEEWGDTEKAEERREEMERVKERKYMETKNSQRKDHLAALSLLRGALNSFDGDKGSAQYQNRLRKIHNIESALKNNLTFTFHDFLEKKTPFLYAKNMDLIVQKEDIFFSYGEPYEIFNLNFKKLQIAAKPLRERESYRPLYSSYQAAPIDRTKKLDIAGIKKEHRFRYFSKLNNFNKDYILCLDNEQFYSISDQKYKEEQYYTHLECTGYNSNYRPVRFFKSGTNNDIIVSQYEYAHHNENEPKPVLLNPFNENDRKIIEESIPKGLVFYNELNRDEDIAGIKSCYPELFNLLPKYLTKNIGEVAEEVPETMPDTTLKANTAENFRENVSMLIQQYGYRGNPFAAVKTLIAAAASEDRSLIKKELLDMGCTDEHTTRKVIASWGNKSGTAISPEKEKEPVWER